MAGSRNDVLCSDGGAIVARSAWLAISVVAAFRLVRLVSWDTDFVAATLLRPDDAYYYYQIAWNLGRGRGSTFDGLHSTNGYQPLWQLLLAALARGAATRADLLRAAAVLATALHGITGALLSRIAFRLFRQGAPLIVLMLWVFHPRIDILMELERPLNGLLLAGWILAELRATDPSLATGARERWWHLGSWLAAVSCLARLDNVVFVLPMLVLRRDGVTGPSARTLARRLRAVAPVGAVVGAYVLAEALLFGVASPVSGSIKARSHARVLFELAQAGDLRGMAADLGRAYGRCLRSGLGPIAGPWLAAEPQVDAWWPLAFLAPLAGLGVWLAVARRDSFHSGEAASVFRRLGTGAALHFVAIGLLVHQFAQPWYFVPETIWGVAVIGGAVGCLASGGARWIHVAKRIVTGALAMHLALITVDVLARERRPRRSIVAPTCARIALARSVGDRLGPGRRVGAFSAGYLGYFTDLAVVSLDGFVNQPDYLDRVRAIGLPTYLREEGVDYLVDIWRDPEILPFVSTTNVATWSIGSLTATVVDLREHGDAGR